MANSPQARKRARQAEGRRARNASLRSRVRTTIKKVIVALNAADADAASSAFQAVQPEIDKMVNKGIFSANKAARTKSRLNARIKALKAA
ncbi:30S ribosomal protein S20 [Litorivicinus lipolyticus]|uniref:Small ribosomal subunit protein bS20 n=1 Tax=Litorivicinus lipolyticus TaxID=418701 RepID=A0A5Q2QFV1_9GAMM|nr:30S ribosomal protein S20 [Litorivicinus lipolyticus]QGG80906.1 30S ribosomal protein S20 [Litorivicinus lipolyticus]